MGEIINQILQSIVQDSNATTNLLILVSIVLSGVIVVQWKYMRDETVPKDFWQHCQDEVSDIKDKVDRIYEQIQAQK